MKTSLKFRRAVSVNSLKEKYMECPETPECDKIFAVRSESEKIGQFLEWLEQGAKLAPKKGKGRRAAVSATAINLAPTRLCTFYEDSSREGDWIPVRLRIEELLAHYFKIDLDIVEQEKCALLKYQRSLNDQ